MPVTVAPNDILTVRLEYSDESALGDVALNVLKYRVAALNDETTGLPSAIAIPWENVAGDWVQHIYSALANTWKSFASEDAVMIGASIQRTWPNPRSEMLSYTPGAPVSGIILGDSLPMQDAVTLLKRTGFGSRWGLGRLFVPGIPELHAEGGQITAAAVANLATFMTALLADQVVAAGGVNATLVPVLTGPGSPPVRINDITGVQLSDTIIKTQRRRRPGKGS